jgi:hypothetical protein
MKNGYVNYRIYAIRRNGSGYNAFVGTSTAFPRDLKSVARVKIAIDLWVKYSMNYPKFIKYFNLLTVRYPKRYNNVWGKLKTVAELRKLSRP